MANDLLTDALLQAVPKELHGALSRDRSEAFVRSLCERIRAAHPELPLTPALLSFIGARLTRELIASEGEGFFVEDLALAHGCVTAHRVALERFEHDVLGPIFRQQRTDADAAQAVREKLWVGRKLEEYAGRGPLQAWTRMVVRRQTLNDARRELPVVKDDLLDEPLLGIAAEDPEFLALGEDARATLKAALREALLGLAPEQRELLRLHHLQGVPHGELGKRLSLPRSTVAFRLQRCREELLAATRLKLQDLLGERRSDADTLLRALGDNWELSLSLLRTDL